MRRFLCLVLMLSCLSSSVVYASDINEGGTETTASTDESTEETTAAESTPAASNMSALELGEALGAIIPEKLGAVGNPAVAECIGESAGLMISALREDGYSDEAIAGVICNFAYESMLDPYLWEGHTSEHHKIYREKLKTYSYGELKPDTYGGCGLGQWTYERHGRLSQHCKDTDPDSVVITNSTWRNVYGSSSKSTEDTYLGSSGTQVAYIIIEGHWTAKHADTAGEASVNSLDAYKTVSDPELAAKLWCACWETPGGWQTEMLNRAKPVKEVLNVVKAYSGGAALKKESEKLGGQLVSAGYWTEAELSEYAKLEEMNVQAVLNKANRDDIEGEDLEGLSIWERNIRQDKSKGGFVGAVRITKKNLKKRKKK